MLAARSLHLTRVLAANGVGRVLVQCCIPAQSVLERYTARRENNGGVGGRVGEDNGSDGMPKGRACCCHFDVSDGLAPTTTTTPPTTLPHDDGPVCRKNNRGVGGWVGEDDGSNSTPKECACRRIFDDGAAVQSLIFFIITCCLYNYI